MGAGYNLFNTVMVVRATEAVLAYLADTHGWEALRTRGLFIGYDARHHSETFAKAAANVCLEHQVVVALADRCVPTPLVAFAVVHQHRCAGIMITASHNPKEYNGYKLFNDQGAQLSSEAAKAIEARIRTKSTEHTIRVQESHFRADRSTMPRQPVEALWRVYMQQAREELYVPLRVDASRLCIVHTALHGVADPYLAQLFEAFELPAYVPTVSQQQPNAEFPTASPPNPEEGARVLQQALQTAEKLARTGADAAITKAVVVLANDPDADRLAVAELVPGPEAKWYLFHGDELGVLLAWWMMQQVKNRGTAHSSDEAVLINSVVSSRMLEAFADQQRRPRCRFLQHYPGFKWLSKVALEEAAQNRQVLLVYEEALGYALGGLRSGRLLVPDKDGISTGVVVAQMAYFCHQNEKFGSLQGLLERLFREYGLYLQYSGYLRCRDFTTLTPLFERIRQRLRNGELLLFTADDGSGGGKPLPPRRYQVQSVFDWTQGYHCAYGCDPVPLTLPPQPKSHFMTFYIRESDERRQSLQKQLSPRERGPTKPQKQHATESTSGSGTVSSAPSPSLPGDAAIRVTLRSSGTEPKLKFYSELHLPLPSQVADRNALRQSLRRAVRALIEAFLQPALHGLEYGSSS
jgi:phosphomannomutase